MDIFSVGERNDVVEFTVDDEEWGFDVSDAFVIWEEIAGEDGVFESDGVSGFEGRNEDESGGLGVRSQPDGWAAADGATDDDDGGGRDAGLDRVIPSSLDGLLGGCFRGSSGSEAIAGVVVGDDAEASVVEGGEDIDVLADVFRVAVAVDDGFFAGLGFEVNGGDVM